MSFNSRLKKVANWVAVVSSTVALHTEPLSSQTNHTQEGTKPTPTVLLDQRVERGIIINGETQAERSARWKSFKAENGVQTTLNAMQQEKIKKIEIPHKDENGYVFVTYEPEKGRTVESYYPNGVLQAKSGNNGQAYEGYYPDGSRKFVRTEDGVETTYHPGGIKGKEKIKETPHKTLEAYDVLDEEGRRTEHHYNVMPSQPRNSGDGMVYTSRDVKKVDLYNPITQDVIGTYTLDNWGVDEGRVAHIGFLDENGVMKTMDFPETKKNSAKNYYADSLSLDQIKEIFHEEQQDRINEQAQQKAIKDHLPQR
ncbi:MAG: hypothetical protein IKS41_05445 [Alphaproteobacteria bacterium]|nr:hypothetical protein [Alphaproteobacteria bacterium]